MADRIDAELTRRDPARLPSSIGIEAPQRLDGGQRRERIVADRIGAERRAHLGIRVVHTERADEVARMAAPGGPFLRHARRQIFAEAEARAGEVAEEVRYAVEAEVRRRPHPQLAERRPVAPVTALRANDKRTANALDLGQEAERLAAEAVPDDEHIAWQVLKGDGRIEQRPVAHACRHLAQIA